MSTPPLVACPGARAGLDPARCWLCVRRRTFCALAAAARLPAADPERAVLHA